MQTSSEFDSQLVHKAIELPFLSALAHEAEKWYSQIATLGNAHGPFNVSNHIPSNIKYLPTASSIGLSAIKQPGDIISALSVDVKQTIKQILGENPICNIDISWLRRQYPACFKDPIATPHSWHQDGAYGIDFMDEKNERSLLPMVTIWLPLHICGQSAPGIELILDSPHAVLAPSELMPESIGRRFAKHTYWQPEMAPGDALLIASHTIHRTYQKPSMINFRGCVELRFLSPKIYGNRLSQGSCIKLAI